MSVAMEIPGGDNASHLNIKINPTETAWFPSHVKGGLLVHVR